MHVRLISSTVCKKCSIFIFCFHIFVTFIYTQMAFFKSKSCIKTARNHIEILLHFFFINHAKREELDLQNEMIQQKVIWIFWKKSRQKKKNFYHFMPQSFQFVRTFLVIFFWRKCSVSEGVKQTKKWQNLSILAIEALYYYPFSLHYFSVLCQLCVRSMQPNRYFLYFFKICELLNAHV